ncbi:unnamed protein product [Rotaria sp. Silwood2]|nr:unnamed protein product [Rotaria sp. Silwood2]CAF3109701.1 unnamed protein product [Rotaria sp. Silwood2]CAF3422778.1 unnamed protein product [Rotaria sp. Silwood2]CAF4202715.1 unnamed protein product [Rotaria sp. Silwood2]CAF4401472.1 unnamed protein product [Rotaria sp. Silwood2]
MLLMVRVPHNIHVVNNESIVNVESWKAKHSGLFVLNIGLPIGVACLPVSYSSHWAVYFTSKTYGTPPSTHVPVTNNVARTTSSNQDIIPTGQIFQQVQNMVANKKNERQTRKLLTFDDDDNDDNESDGNESCEEIVGLDGSSSYLSTKINKKTFDHPNDLYQTH